MKNLESFNRLSKVDFYYCNKTEENLLPDYDGLTYVRLMKKFEPEKVNFLYTFPKLKMTACKSCKGLTFVDDHEIDLNEEMNKPFHLRCYLPKSNVTRKTGDGHNKITRNEKKTHRVVIMFNGLNEIEHFDLYDVLGECFTNNGMSAILLPTPFHLNRRVYKETLQIGDEKSESVIKKFLPTEFATITGKNEKGEEISNGDLFYSSFLKGYNELKELSHKIKGDYVYNTNAENYQLEKGFYETYFHGKYEHIEIILFGYSLGGLKSVSYFLKDPQLFRCCISFNSGANLLESDTNELNIDPNIWVKMLSYTKLIVDKGEKNIKLNEINIGINSDFDNEEDVDIVLRKAFLALYFGEVDERVKINLEQSIDRYLAISGGSDKIVRIDQMKSIAPKEKHIHQVIVAGVDHHPTKDPNWYNVLPRIERNIVDFINTCDEEHWTKERVVEKMAIILEKVDYFKTLHDKYNNEDQTIEFNIEELNILLEKIKDVKNEAIKNDFIKFYYISKAYYPNFEELIVKIGRKLFPRQPII